MSTLGWTYVEFFTIFRPFDLVDEYEENFRVGFFGGLGDLGVNFYQYVGGSKNIFDGYRVSWVHDGFVYEPKKKITQYVHIIE